MTTAQKPTIGRIVHYVLPDGPKRGEARAALITGLVADETVNLTVFLDGGDDLACPYLTAVDATMGVLSRKYGVEHDETGGIGAWHWPPRG